MCLQREPLADITNKPKTKEEAVQSPTPTRRRINPSAIVEASARERLLHVKAMQFIVAVEQYAIEHRVAPVLDMLEVFKAAYDAVVDRHPTRSSTMPV